MKVSAALHAHGTFDIQTGDSSVFVHYSMFAADIIAFVGLIVRRQFVPVDIAAT